MAGRIKVSAVSYINTYPFILGLREHAVSEQIELQLDVPSTCARKLIDREVSIGLVPVAAIPLIADAHIISDKCIGADGKVDSVCLFSDVPLKNIERVLLDPQSRTSVRLARMLAEQFWNIRPEWVSAEKGFMNSIKDTTAGVIIGDRALKPGRPFAFKTDLAEQWKLLTGLPFVFACWVSNVALDPSFVEAFDQALELGLMNKERAINEMSDSNQEEMIHYLKHRISYRLDDKKRNAMKLFLDWASKAE